MLLKKWRTCAKIYTCFGFLSKLIKARLYVVGWPSAEKITLIVARRAHHTITVNPQHRELNAGMMHRNIYPWRKIKTFSENCVVERNGVMQTQPAKSNQKKRWDLYYEELFRPISEYTVLQDTVSIKTIAIQTDKTAHQNHAAILSVSVT